MADVYVVSSRWGRGNRYEVTFRETDEQGSKEGCEITVRLPEGIPAESLYEYEQSVPVHQDIQIALGKALAYLRPKLPE